ncbi:bifunctional lysine-specific demethylase and histidyl-hydroxylase NO66 isoform X1 [Megalopta genalis]|uniref:bifunctional lysine-specific demethylase and histidyl-hydroxylase NO66 isoform X1 n=2 Tax=Megalopta genalis TaxID=115081 RepID=UPI003FD0C2D3
MMLKYHEPISAFAVQAMKRKNIELTSKSKKLKKKHVTPVKRVTLRNDTKEVTEQQLNKTAVSANQQKTNKTSTSKKLAPSALKKSKSLRSFYQLRETNRKIVNNSKGSKTKLQLKSPLMVNAGVAKMKHINQKHSKQKKKVNELFPPKEVKMPEDYQKNPFNISHSSFELMIHPLKVEDFLEKYWEQTPVHIKRNCNTYYKLLMSTPIMDKILRESYIQFTKNIDITSYENGVRETHNPIGRAVPSVVWDYYGNGCSVRMLNPQTYIPILHSLNATLQEFFGCFVGANAYLTPPNSQGFAPHYDDIEAFILQVEGQKRWRLYKPRYEKEYLPRFSSRNFEDSEIGEPILDTVVKAGDLLYFPRGTIHQGTAMESHSLHITLSVYQKNSWTDFLEKLLPDALKTATENDSEFRKGLPFHYLRHTGFAHSENQSSSKEEFREQVRHLLRKLVDHIDVDKAADLMAKNHVHDFLPPFLSEVEQECSVLQDGERMTANGCVKYRVEIEPDTRIRLLRSHCIRLVKEHGTFRIYYSSENSKEYHEYEPQFLEVGKKFVPAVKEIIQRYPEFISVKDLPIFGEDNQIQIAKDLWEKCIVVTDEPLCVID